MKKFLRWLASLFGYKGNTTTTSQVKILKGRTGGKGEAYYIAPLGAEELREISKRAVAAVAEKKIVTNTIAESKAVKTSPGPNAKSLKADDLKKAVNASRQRQSVKRVNNDDDYRRRNDDLTYVNTTTISDSYSHHTVSHSSSHDSYSSCDSSSSSSGSCD